MPSERAMEAEQLARAYVEATRAEVERSFWAEADRIPLGAAAKVGAQGFAMPNGCIVVVYRTPVEEDFWSGQDAQWDALRERIGERDYAHIALFYPGHGTGAEDLRALAIEDCKRALARRAWAPSFALAHKEIKEVRGQLRDLFTSNPWLEKTLAAASGRLAAAEDRISTVEASRTQQERARPFDDYEDLVERAERYDSKDSGRRVERINSHTAELFAREFVRTYRKRVESQSLPPGGQPPLYRAYPFKIAAHVLPNKSLLLTFRHSADASGFEATQAGFERAAELLDTPAGAFVLALNNDARLESAEAKYLAEQIGDRTVVDAKAATDAKELSAALIEVERDIQAAGKTNPWLGPQATKMAEALARGRNALEKVVGESEGQLQVGAVLYNELVRTTPALAPHADDASAAAKGGAALAGGLPRWSGPVQQEIVSKGTGSGTTRAAEPQTANVPENPAHVFQEVSYYDFPQSDTVRELEMGRDVSREIGLPSDDLVEGGRPPAVPDELGTKAAELETRVGELEQRLFYMERYTEMIQEKHLEQTKKLRELVQVEGKRNRSRSTGIALGALLVALAALIPVWPQTLEAIRAFFASIGLG